MSSAKFSSLQTENYKVKGTQILLEAHYKDFLTFVVHSKLLSAHVACFPFNFSGFKCFFNP
jgi:hypothetical protein